MVSSIIKKIMKDKNIKALDLAKHFSVTPQAITNKFSRDTWTAQELIDILDFMDCQLIVQSKPDTIYIFSKSDIK